MRPALISPSGVFLLLLDDNINLLFLHFCVREFLKSKLKLIALLCKTYLLLEFELWAIFPWEILKLTTSNVQFVIFRPSTAPFLSRQQNNWPCKPADSTRRLRQLLRQPPLLPRPPNQRSQPRPATKVSFLGSWKLRICSCCWLLAWAIVSCLSWADVAPVAKCFLKFLLQ